MAIYGNKLLQAWAAVACQRHCECAILLRCALTQEQRNVANGLILHVMQHYPSVSGLLLYKRFCQTHLQQP
jgi:hypothetical protein